jgi:ABC-type sugar transport system, ATPase component
MSMADNVTSAPIVQMTGISVTFPGVKALDNVDFRLFPGEVHAIMGENGAGKSTLIKALTGVNQLASGSITVDGEPYVASRPEDSMARGIQTVYQEVNLCPNMTVAENVMLGHEVRSGFVINWRATRRIARENLRRMHLDIDPRSELSSHTIAVQQLCAIARALVGEAKVLILDEPTSSLDREEVDELFAVIRELRESGVAILFVSHFLDQVFEISDRMTVLRNGQFIGEYMTSELDRRSLVEKMVGRTVAELDDIAQGADKVADADNREVVLKAEGLAKTNSVFPFDLEVHEGEIFGFAGLLGSGRTEAVRLLSGADSPDHGRLQIDGVPAKFASPLAALKKGVAYSTEDRKKEGIISDLSVRENIALALQSIRGAFRPIPKVELDGIVDKFMNALNIQPRNPNALIKNLSGGNQQKVLLARWLATNPELLILDEPTRGIDVGAKAEIQRLVADLAKDDTSVIYLSSELVEVVRLCGRVAVMRDRHMVATLDRSEKALSEGDILETIAESAADFDGEGNE